MPYKQFWGPGTPLMGPPEGKSLNIDTVSQNTLNETKKS